MERPFRRFAVNLSVGSLAGAFVITVILCGGLLVIFRWLHVANEDWRRTSCSNKLRLLGAATEAYQAQLGALPPSVVGPDQPTWAFFLWPYREAAPVRPDMPPDGKTAKTAADPNPVADGKAAEKKPPPADLSLVNRYDFRKACTDPDNAALLAEMTWPGFFCPTRRAGIQRVEVDGLSAQPGDYACVGPPDGGDPFDPRSSAMLIVAEAPGGDATFTKVRGRTTRKDIIDGLSVTAMIGEKHIVDDGLWNAALAIDGGDGPVMLGRPMYFTRLMGAVVDRSLATGPNDRSATDLFGSWHPDVCLFLMGDGSVKELHHGTDRRVLSALAARNDSAKSDGK